jgi:hypothetical protein
MHPTTVGRLRRVEAIVTLAKESAELSVVSGLLKSSFGNIKKELDSLREPSVVALPPRTSVFNAGFKLNKLLFTLCLLLARARFIIKILLQPGKQSRFRMHYINY